MPLEVVDIILRNSDSFRQLLVLSATPRLGDSKWRDRLLRLLEPERFAFAKIKEMVPDEYFEVLENEAVERLQEDSAFDSALAFTVWSLQRRIIRQTRADWGRYLPSRKVKKVELEPLEGWRRAVELLQAVLRKHEHQNNLKEWPWTVARNVHKRRWSAMDALELVRKREVGLAGQAMEIHEQIKGDPGEVRLEALVDIISGHWLKNPKERFIIVAGDNPGIDLLAGALHRYFPELEEKGAMVQLKRPRGVAETAFDSIAEMARLIEPFERGEARILLLGDWVQAGLNLQHRTRNIIFYSLPWEHDSIDQLIGRIDRLQHNGLWKVDKDSRQGYVNIWYLVMRGTPEERVAQGFEALRLFDYPMPPLSQRHAGMLEERTKSLARGQNVKAVLAELSEMAVGWHESDNSSSLKHPSHFSPDRAKHEYEAWKTASLPEPILLPSKEGLPLVTRGESALHDWLRLIEKSHDFNIGFYREDKNDENLTFWTFWYEMKENGFRGRYIVSPFTLSYVRDERWMSDHAPFICKRQYMQAPPRKRVNTDEGEGAPRLLRFMDHGDDLHDGLLKGYIELGDKHFGNEGTKGGVVVRLPGDHPALSFERQTLLLTISFSDPARAFSRPAELYDIKQLIAGATTDRQKADLKLDIRGLREMMRVDERWLRMKFPARLDLHAARLIDHGWHDIKKEHVADLFRPLTKKKVENKTRYFIARGTNDTFSISATDLRIGLTHYRQQAIRLRSEAWATGMRELETKFSSRLEQIRVEGEDLIALRKVQLEQQENKEPVGADRRQYNMWRGQVEAAERRVKMAELILAARSKALKSARTALLSGDILPDHQWHFLVRFVSADE